MPYSCLLNTDSVSTLLKDVLVILLHLDILFAKNFFQSGVWNNEFEGIASGSSVGSSQFIKFSDANSDPIQFFDARKREIKLNGRRIPNKLTLEYLNVIIVDRLQNGFLFFLDRLQQVRLLVDNSLYQFDLSLQ